MSQPESTPENVFIGSIQKLINGINIAQNNGAFTLEQSAALYNVIKYIKESEVLQRIKSPVSRRSELETIVENE